MYDKYDHTNELRLGYRELQQRQERSPSDALITALWRFWEGLGEWVAEEYENLVALSCFALMAYGAWLLNQ